VLGSYTATFETLPPVQSRALVIGRRLPGASNYHGFNYHGFELEVTKAPPRLRTWYWADTTFETPAPVQSRALVIDRRFPGAAKYHRLDLEATKATAFGSRDEHGGGVGDNRGSDVVVDVERQGASGLRVLEVSAGLAEWTERRLSRCLAAK